MAKHPPTSSCARLQPRKSQDGELGPKNDADTNVEDKSIVHHEALLGTTDFTTTRHEQADDGRPNYCPAPFTSSPVLAQEDAGNINGMGFLIDESYGLDSQTGDVNKVAPENIINMSPSLFFSGDEAMINNCSNITGAPTLGMELKKLATFLDLEDEWREA